LTNSVLITGASGLVGSRLTELLTQKGYRVSHLGRKKRTGTIPSFVWNVERGELDAAALQNIDVIIHLAGTGVADKRWNAEHKKDILESRTKSGTLLFEALKNNSHHVKTVISASGIGYYGYQNSPIPLSEESLPGDDFLAQVVVDWEKSVDAIQSLGIRVVKIRIGIVLSGKGGALVEIARPVRLGVGSPLGSGKQMMSWIHLDDTCEIFIKAVEEQSMTGSYNAVAPHPATNQEITRQIGKVLKRPLWLPHVPAFVLRVVVGEMASVVLNGAIISSEKIQMTGFQFQFPQLDKALENLLRK